MNAISFRPPTAYPEHLRSAFAISQDGAIGKHWKDAAQSEGANKTPKVRTLWARTAQNHKKNTQGTVTVDKPTLDKFALENPMAIGNFNVKAGRMIDRSIYSRNAETLDSEVRNVQQAEASAARDAEDTHKQIYQALKKRGIPYEKIVNESRYLGKDDERLEFPKGVHGDPELQQLFRATGDSLKKQRDYKGKIAELRDCAEMNRTLAETMRHPSYRALARVATPQVRKQMFDWLNIVGLLTMILTIPLMYEGLKQWVQSVRQPQSQEAGGQ